MDRINKLGVEISPINSTDIKYQKKILNTMMRTRSGQEKFTRSFCKNTSIKQKIKKSDHKKKQNNSTIHKKSPNDLEFDITLKKKINKQSKMNKNFTRECESENLIKKLDDNFKSFESNIIDKKYENVIDHDEIIIGADKKDDIYDDIKNYMLKNSKLIKLGNNKYDNINYDNNDKHDNFNNDNNDHNEHNVHNDNNINIIYTNISKDDFEIKDPEIYNEEDEYLLLNSKFEEFKNDIYLMYTTGYEKNINKKMLGLEILLFLEKITDLQAAYHEEYNRIKSINKNEKESFLFYETILKSIEIKIDKLNRIKRSMKYKINHNDFLLNPLIKNNKDTVKIDLLETNIYKNILQNNKQKHKEKLIEIFLKIINNKSNAIKNKLTNIEKKIIDNFKKRYNNHIIHNSGTKIKVNGIIPSKSKITSVNNSMNKYLDKNGITSNLKTNTHMKSNSLAYDSNKNNKKQKPLFKINNVFNTKGKLTNLKK